MASEQTHHLRSAERNKIVALYLTIALSTVVGVLLSAWVGRQSLLLAGLGVVAYVFGLRHGVDADHIAAIDNVTRKLMQEGKRPLTAGTWFSLGHSTVVVCLVVLLVVSTRAIVNYIPSLQQTGAVVGTLISGVFLFALGVINVLIVSEIYGIFKSVRTGSLAQQQLEDLLNKRGFMNRYFGSLLKIVREPWQLYMVGLLFGLGFDTASEIALIALSVGVGVASQIPMWTVLLLPFMFTCGMVLADTSDGLAMFVAYNWAFLKPIRKIYYNLTITIISVIVAFFIGGIEIVQILIGEFGLKGLIWSWIENLDFETIGFAIVGVFVVAWIASIILYRVKHIESP